MPDSNEGFYGRLEHASPFELGQFLLLGRKTGVLHLHRGDERGELHVREGQIVAAVGPDLRGGSEAAMKLLRWTEGEFRFAVEPVPPSEEISVGTENLMLETARRMDESGEEEQQVAAALEQADELSRTFAAISAATASGPAGEGHAPGRWVVEAPGRSLFHMRGYGLMGADPGDVCTRLDESTTPDPGRILGQKIGGPPFDDWITHQQIRFYLSWGAEGYRLVHPFPHPSIDRHLRDPAEIGQRLGDATAVAIYGPSGAGKSLLAALLASAQAAGGCRILYLTGVPTHDLGDGDRILHVVSPPGSDVNAAREILDRWRSDAVVMDIEPSPASASFARWCHRGSIPLVITLRAPERKWAGESIRHLMGESDDWRFLAPSRVAAGPILEVTQAAA